MLLLMLPARHMRYDPKLKNGSGTAVFLTAREPFVAISPLTSSSFGATFSKHLAIDVAESYSLPFFVNNIN